MLEYDTQIRGRMNIEREGATDAGIRSECAQLRCIDELVKRRPTTRLAFSFLRGYPRATGIDTLQTSQTGERGR